MTEPNHDITPFNWHDADRDSFASWAVIAMISDGQPDRTANTVLALTDGGRDIRLTLDINGFSFDGMPFFERLWQEMQIQVQIHAAELIEVELTKLNETRAAVERTLTIAELDIRRKFKALGLPMTDPKDEWS